MVLEALGRLSQLVCKGSLAYQKSAGLGGESQTLSHTGSAQAAHAHARKHTHGNDHPRYGVQVGAGMQTGSNTHAYAFRHAFQVRTGVGGGAGGAGAPGLSSWTVIALSLWYPLQRTQSPSLQKEI